MVKCCKLHTRYPDAAAFFVFAPSIHLVAAGQQCFDFLFLFQVRSFEHIVTTIFDNKMTVGFLKFLHQQNNKWMHDTFV